MLKLHLGLGIVCVIATFLFAADDGRHHWHEFRALYSAAHYSMSDLMSGAFDPGPATPRSPEEVANWYLVKPVHIYLLQKLVQVAGNGVGGYIVVKSIYGSMIVMAVGLFGVLLHRIGMGRTRIALTCMLILFSPIGLYISFKLLEESPALLFTSAALAVLPLRNQYSVRTVLFSCVAGLLLALGALSNWRMPLLFLSFWAAFILVPPIKNAQKSVIQSGIIACIVFSISVIVGVSLLNASPSAYFQAIINSLHFTKTLPMWLFTSFNILLFGTGLWFLMPLAWISREKHTRRFFLLWLLFCMVSAIFAGLNFLEPRFLICGIVPFAGLIALGIEAVWQRIQMLGWNWNSKAAVGSVLAVFIFAGSAIAQRLMPYELDAKQLIRALETEAPSPESAIILVPWNYSDFHFLRLVFPQRPVYLVQSPVDEKGEIIHDASWVNRFKSVYGHRFLPNADAFPAEFAHRKALYIGWSILPSLQNLHNDLELLGLSQVAAHVDSSKFMNHMTQSWLIGDSRFTLRKSAQFGQYRVYDVRTRRVGQWLNEAVQTLPASAEDIPLWGLFETSFSSSRNYGNPFVDAEVEALFVAPSGKIFHTHGFYDGDGKGGQDGNVWKLRFMCSEEGHWSWSAAFSDGSIRRSGSFRCNRSFFPGPLRVNAENPHWFRTANGAHFLPRWFYLPELLFTKEGNWQQDIDNHLVENGYNMVAVLTTQAEVLSSKRWNRREYDRPFFYPWTKRNRTVFWDTMELSSWRKLDRVLEYLRDHNVYIYFFDGFLPNIAPRFPDNPIEERLYLRYAIARIGAYWNVTHNVTFEFSEFMTASRLNRIGRYIKEIDPFDLLLTAHDTQDFRGLVQSESWLDFANLQYREGTAGNGETSNTFVTGNFYGKPVAATEMVWEGGGKLNAEQVRRGAWGILMAAGFFLYGEFSPFDYGGGEAHSFLKIMLDFMESVPYWKMSPHNELVVETGSFCLANPGSEYVIYVENGGVVTLDLSSARERLAVEWLSPRTGERTSAGTVIGGNRQTFKAPQATEGDWVLHLGGSKTRS